MLKGSINKSFQTATPKLSGGAPESSTKALTLAQNGFAKGMEGHQSPLTKDFDDQPKLKVCQNLVLQKAFEVIGSLQGHQSDTQQSLECMQWLILAYVSNR